MTPAAVGITCLVVTVLVLLWDALLYRDRIERNSISQVIIDKSKKSLWYPAMICFWIGFLVCHWFGL